MLSEDQFCKKNIYLLAYLFTYLAAWVLVVAHRIFSCSKRDLVTWPGIEPWPPCTGSVASKPLDHHGSREDKFWTAGVVFHSGTVPSFTQPFDFPLKCQSWGWEGFESLRKFWCWCLGRPSAFSCDPASLTHPQAIPRASALCKAPWLHSQTCISHSLGKTITD